MKTINLLLLFLFSTVLFGQSAKYHLKTDTKAYAPAASLVKVSPKNFADGLPSFDIQLPFAFKIDSAFYNEATVLREGGLLFLTPSFKATHVIFGLGAKLTTKDSTTGVYTETTGTVGNRSFIIEYRWFGIEGSAPGDFTNFSITLFEGSNEFEINYGLHSNFDTSLYSLKKGPVVGLFNQDTVNTQETLASYYLTDKPEDPTFNFNSPPDSLQFSLCGHVPHNTSYRFAVNNTTTVKEVSGSKNFTVYPNPISGAIMTVEFTETDNYTIGLSDLNGKIVRQFYSEGTDNVKLDIEGIKSGMYFLNIATNTKLLPQRKIMIN
jgi:hypothetical protein